MLFREKILALWSQASDWCQRKKAIVKGTEKKSGFETSG
jgi:hypothetical protein